MVLTEGYDAPSMRYLILARPTKSPVLYEQIIGRVARAYFEKYEGEVIHLVSHRAEKRIAAERENRERKSRKQARDYGESLVRVFLYELYLASMLRHLSELDQNQIVLLARNFTSLCGSACAWLPLTVDGPLFTVVPCSNHYDAYKDAIFAIAGPADKYGKVIIFACRAQKDFGPWKVADDNFVKIEASPAEATHRFVEYARESSNFARQWLAKTSSVPNTAWPLISGSLPKPPRFRTVSEDRLEFLQDMSAAVLGYYKAILSGRIFIAKKWKTAKIEKPNWLKTEENGERSYWSD